MSPVVIARSVRDDAIQSLLLQSGLLRFARNDEENRGLQHLMHIDHDAVGVARG
jgi:hypothetical protein